MTDNGTVSILLSIHPKWAELILEGTKKLEVRKTFFRELERGSTIYLYATSPVKKVVGKCQCDGGWAFDCHCPDWAHEQSCLSRKELKEYLGVKRGLFMELYDPIRYENPKELSEFGLVRPPQSFCYIRQVV